jgi:hypothetical protein
MTRDHAYEINLRLAAYPYELAWLTTIVAGHGFIPKIYNRHHIKVSLFMLYLFSFGRLPFSLLPLLRIQTLWDSPLHLIGVLLMMRNLRRWWPWKLTLKWLVP